MARARTQPTGLQQTAATDIYIRTATYTDALLVLQNDFSGAAGTYTIDLVLADGNQFINIANAVPIAINEIACIALTNKGVSGRIVAPAPGALATVLWLGALLRVRSTTFLHIGMTGIEES